MHCLTCPLRAVHSRAKLTCYNFLVSRKNSDKGAKSKRYSDTLNLPKTTFPLTLREGAASARELNIQKVCAFEKLYEWQTAQDRDRVFVLHDGPPYANGKPHVGHAINKILKDITNRYKLLRGYKVQYVPGWDCHGLPIELKAVDHQKGLSALEIRRKARKFAVKTISLQKAAFKRWGVMADWERCYTTLDHDYQANQWETFYSMYQQGLIYQDYMPVYWSPSSRTALAEAELEYNEQHVSSSVYIAFPLVGIPEQIRQLLGTATDVCAVVWTTTPWTLPFNQAICYNKSIEYAVWRDDSCGRAYLCEEAFSARLAEIVGSQLTSLGTVPGHVLKSIYVHPLTKRRLPLLAGDHVVTGRGTGLVHTAPAHGHDDFQLAVKYGLPMGCEVDEEGRYLATVGPHLAGKTVGVDADDAVLDQLGSSVLHKEPFTHSYPYDWRTKKPVIIRASKQWFINTSKLRDAAVECLKSVNIHPANSEKVMLSQLGNRTYWCISRQRVWGLPIPVFYNKITNEPLLNRDVMDHLQKLLVKHGSDFWWTLDMADLLPESILKEGLGSHADYMKGDDILDIWFDSGTSWATILKDSDHQADVYLEGLDQYGCWFQTSLLTSVATNNKAPYRNLIVHGFTTDEEGKKMSKSIGNVVDPAVIINGGKDKQTNPSYGADIMRWWTAHWNLKPNVMIGTTILDRYVEEMFNLRRSVRHLLGNISDFDPKTQSVSYSFLLPQDKYMLHLLQEFAHKVERWYDSYSYNHILLDLERFINNKVSRFYGTITKDRCYCGPRVGLPRLSSLTVQRHLLEILVKSVAPIVPHFADEVYQHHPKAVAVDGVKSIFRTGWFDVPAEWNNPSIAQAMESVFAIRDDINRVLTSENPVEFNAVIFASHNLAECLKIFQTEEISSSSPLNEVLQMSCTTLLDHTPTVVPDDADTVDGVCDVFVEGVARQETYKLILLPADHHICERCRRYTATSASTPCQRCLDVIAEAWVN